MGRVWPWFAAKIRLHCRLKRIACARLNRRENRTENVTSFKSAVAVQGRAPSAYNSIEAMILYVQSQLKGDHQLCRRIHAPKSKPRLKDIVT